MSTVTENDLKDLITQLNDRINDRFNKVEEKLNDMRVDIATLKEGQNNIDKRLNDIQLSTNKRLDDMQLNTNKRLDNLDAITRTVIRWSYISLARWFS